MESLGTSLRTIFSKQQHFEGVIGNPALNRLGLHGARIAVSDLVLRLRRAQRPERDLSSDERTYLRDGILVVPEFFDPSTFAAVRDEVDRENARVEASNPKPVRSDEIGFGRKKPFDGGFDRFDGDTLNRFVALTNERTPATLRALSGHARLARIVRFLAGSEIDPARFEIYETVNGDEADNPDIQKVLHRDTFHSTSKAWIFLHDVTVDDGPFTYVVGSNRMDRARRLWERARALRASEPDGPRDGAFRATNEDLRALGLPEPHPFVVRANTLVVADVRGFHRRGDAVPGSRRVALYSIFRHEPFDPRTSYAKTAR